ncbi:MAG: cupin domain-containing protein [Thermoplasmata archaeon]
MRTKQTDIYRARSGQLLTPPDSRYLRGRVETKRPGEETGTHVTEGREEVLIVLEGTATVELGRSRVRRIAMGPGRALFIPEGIPHNVRNSGGSGLRYLYVRSISAPEKRRSLRHSHH